MTPAQCAGGLLLLAVVAGPAVADGAAGGPDAKRSITDNRVAWPTAAAIREVLWLRQPNTRVVVMGTTVLGIAAGVIGTFAYLRKRSMMGDALSHATLPGIAAAFMITGSKSLLVLISGGAITGVLGVLAVIGIRRSSRIKEDAAIGIVLSVFFGAGVVLLSLVQKMTTGHQAGLQTFIYGKAAAMIHRDTVLIAITALAVIAGAVLCFKEFRLICFDVDFAGSLGWPVVLLDVVMMSLVVLTTIIGLQAVGLIMIVALLIIPAAAARFWTDRLLTMTVLAGAFGAASGYLGSVISALFARMPTGPIIVLTGGAFFVFSMLAAPRRGILIAVLQRVRLRRRIADQNLLRVLAEHEERRGEVAVAFADLLTRRSWSFVGLRRRLQRALRRGDVCRRGPSLWQLTDTGRRRAQRVLRNHRLWEVYLIRYADIAPSHVDRDADEVEHVLSPALIRELDRALRDEQRIPPSPHAAGA